MIRLHMLFWQENSSRTRVLINFLVVLFSLFIEIHFCFSGLSHFFFFSLYKSVLSLLSRLAPKCQFSLSFTPTCIPTVRCLFMLMPRYAFLKINSGFESLPFPLYLLFYPSYHHPSNLPLLLNVVSLLQVFLKLHYFFYSSLCIQARIIIRVVYPYFSFLFPGTDRN